MTGDQHPLDSNKKLTERLDIDFALQAAGLGVWEIDPATNKVYWDDRCRALVGLDKDDTMPFEEAIQYIHPDDLGTVLSAIQRAMTVGSDGRFDQTYRTLGADGGKLRWVRFWGQAYFTPSGNLHRFSGVAQEVTELVAARHELTRQQEQLRSIIQQTPAPTLVLRGDEYRIDQINPPMLAFMGRGEDVVGQPLLSIMPELADQYIWQQVQRVYREGVTFDQPEVLVPHVRNGVTQTLYYNVSYRPLREGEQVTGVIQVAIDVTEQVVMRGQMEQTQRQVLDIFEQSPVGIAIISQHKLSFQMANSFYGYLVGRTPAQLIGKPLLDALPELAGQGFDQLLAEVISTGKPFIANEVEVAIIRNERLETIYVDLTYQPRREADDSISGVFVVAIDVTQQVVSRRQIEVSETKLRSLIAAAPAGIGLFVGRDLVIEMPNQTFIDIVGKGPSVEGLPLREAMPELLTEGQPFLNILDDVFTTGVPFLSPASLVKIVQNGVLNDNYYNIAYVPIRDTAGTVYAILDIAIDVTAQVKAEQALRESQATLQSVIDLAELGSYTIDVATNQLTKSSRLADWYGLPEHTDVDTSLNSVADNDRERISLVLADVLLPGSNGAYQVDYTVISQRTGQQRVLRTTGRVQWDSAGQPISIYGAVQDITTQQAVQLALEQQVEQRTEELAANNEELATMNEELAANNEEYIAINEELEEANSLLLRSNENLQTFAYVASHDLQEPLRKIQQFGDLLRTRLTGSAGEEEMNYLERMQVAASRMSTLIKDLLSFSRISTQRNTDTPVRLDKVLDDVLSVLELSIAEAGTQIGREALPTISGDAAQLGQLFQNLLSNALKFRQTDVMPWIHISSKIVAADDMMPGIKPIRQTTAYYCIEVADNGIGFDEKYLDRIFQVFQRLHGRGQYAGTGVGLAICEKVVTNHGGVITAKSQPGQGTTFIIYLPAS